MHILKPLILAAALATPVAALADDERITVTGEGTVQAAPDIATISLGVTTQGATAAEALAANTTALSTVLDRLKGAGIQPRDIQTSNLSINPNWSNFDAETPQKITSYTAMNMVTVTVRNLDSLGTVLDSAVSDGANTLNGLTFGMADPRPMMDEARRRAVADALDRAKLLTGAAGIGLGNVTSISENGGFQPPMPMFRAEAKDAAVPVERGEVGISASVTIVFELKQ